MGRHRKPAPPNVIQLDFAGLVDVVTLKPKPYYVEQHDGTWPPYAEIISSRVISRQPRPLGRRGERKPEFLSDRFPQSRSMKYCGQCGEWVNRLDFSPKADTFDKLHPYCKSCRNRHARRIYWLQKETAVTKAA